MRWWHLAVALFAVTSCSAGNTGAPVSPDHSPPVITLLGANPATVEVGQVYTDAGATAFDTIDGNLTANIVTSNPVVTTAKASFTVTYNVKDRSGNAAAQVTRIVNVVDTVPPVITGVPLKDIYIEATGLTTPYTFTIPVATDLAGIASVSPSNAGPFPLGVTPVTWTATDNSGLTATAMQNVIVQDTIAPVIMGTPLPNIVVEMTGVSTPYTLVAPVASDASGIVSVVANNTGPFGLGTTQIVWTATDGAGHTTTAVQNVIVQDTTPPVIVGVPLADIYVQATGVTTPYTLPTPTATDIAGIASVSANNTGPFGVGTTQVMWTATDKSGLTSTAVQNVIVQDNSTVTIHGTPLPDLYVEATGSTTPRPLTLTTPTATDVSGRTYTVTADNTGPFSLGTTTITWSATDNAGKKVTATQNIIVQDTTAPTITIVTGKGGGSKATASDTVDGDITSKITRSDTTQAGSNVVTYAVSDNQGNKTQKTVATGGVDWVQLISPTGASVDLYAMVHGNSRFVAVGAGGDIYASADGYSWTSQSSGVTFSLHGIAWGGSHFVAVGDQGTIVTSQDGYTWAKQAAPLVRDLYAVTWSGSQFIAVGALPNIGNTPIWSSTDAYSWSPQNTVQATLYGVTFGNSQFVAVGAGGDIYTSADGITWNHRASSTTVDLYSVAWSGSIFVAVGAGGTVVTSANGTTWVKRTIATTKTLASVLWSGAQFIAVGNNGTILTSIDGINWMTHTGVPNKQFTSVAHVGGGYVVAGLGGTIVINGL